MKINVEKIDDFTGHRDCVYTLAKSANENEFFSAAGDGMVVRWNINKPDWGEPVAQVSNSIYSMCFDETRNQLWIGQNFEGIHIIDPIEKAKVGSIKLHSSNIFDIIIHKNNTFVAGGDGVISIIDTEQFAFKKHIKASDKSVRCLAVNPLTNELAAGYSDNTIKIFDLDTFHLKKIIEGHTSSVFTLRYTPNFDKLISGGRDAKLKIWNVEEGYKQEQEIFAHLFSINDIKFSPDGKSFATCSMDKSIKVWSVENFRLLKVIDKARHAGHGTSINKLLWLNFDNHLLSCSDDRTISVWKLL